MNLDAKNVFNDVIEVKKEKEEGLKREPGRAGRVVGGGSRGLWGLEQR